MTVLLVTGVILIFILIMQLISYVDLKRRRKIYVDGKFGKVPKAKEWEEHIRSFYDIVTDGSGVDDITWNDLSMNDVFQRISQCDSSAGEEVLYWKLRKNQMTEEERQLFERRVQTFSEREKERHEIELLLCNIGKSGASYSIPAYLDSIELYLLKNVWIFRILQLLFAGTFVGFLILQTDTAGMLFLTVCVANLLLYTSVKMKNETGLYMVRTAVSLLKNGKKIVKTKECEMLFPDLRQKLQKLGEVTRGAWIMQFMQYGGESGDLQGIFLDYVGGVTLWQVTSYHKVMKRLQKHVQDYFDVYREIGELDVAVSTASFRKSLPWYCTPEFTGNKELRISDVYHPLISDPVENSVIIDKNCLITGSNASGKSTFIKAVAINAILGQSINTCAAGAFVMPVCSVITSMAVKDDLMAGESYFIREIRYLKRILDSLNDEQMTLCAIDEILRGTNTGERIRASRAILEYICGKNCIAMVATHDKELTELLGGRYDNYHFSEEIGENDIAFTYKIMHGPASSHNAVKLLEFAGFPEEIIRASQVM